ncbi:hypothetical protein KSP40_PGU007675 [Platanthera guangdongensis]|uniref:Uncharacterized protein n=1 Tax=Platanthera guangdongensis TaxID=2320717 RepID=A0ABR2MII5_9ASPA
MEFACAKTLTFSFTQFPIAVILRYLSLSSQSTDDTGTRPSTAVSHPPDSGIVSPVTMEVMPAALSKVPATVSQRTREEGEGRLGLQREEERSTLESDDRGVVGRASTPCLRCGCWRRNARLTKCGKFPPVLFSDGSYRDEGARV